MLERLTVKLADEPVYIPDESKWAISDEFGAKCLIGEAVNRLAAYEDSGLSPAEVESLATIASDIPLDRLEEICAAERDGRLIVPPCNVGDTVWVTMAYGETLNPPKKTVVNWFKQHYDGILEARLWMDLGNGYKEYGYGIESFGKIVFLTREEAEKALKGAEKEAQ